MSPSSTINASKAFAGEAVRLLREFTDKLESITKQAFQLADRADEMRRLTAKGDDPRRQRLQNQYQSMSQVFHSMNPAATQLARVVSQRIEHGGLDDLEQAELRLRLAEFEGALMAAQTAVASSYPQW
jgi:hypothetical protein